MGLQPQSRHWALIFTDEASFRQDSTLHATWSRVGCPAEVSVSGERKSVKIFGAIELWRARFDYRQETVFNAATYLGFLEQLARRYRRQGAILIQDNASYQKTATSGHGSSPTGAGWKCISCRRTRQN